jgi:hypothetical protein
VLPRVPYEGRLREERIFGLQHLNSRRLIPLSVAMQFRRGWFSENGALFMRVGMLR